MAGALHRALGMPRAERQERWRAMMAANRGNTIEGWRDSFLSALGADGSVQLLRRAAPF